MFTEFDNTSGNRKAAPKDGSLHTNLLFSVLLNKLYLTGVRGAVGFAHSICS